MKIKDALNLAKNELKGYENQAIFILCEHLQKDRTWLFFNENFEFDETFYLSLIKRFKNGEAFEREVEKDKRNLHQKLVITIICAIITALIGVMIRAILL